MGQLRKIFEEAEKTFNAKEHFNEVSVGTVIKSSSESLFYGVAVKVVDFGSEDRNACWTTSGYDGMYNPEGLLSLSSVWYLVGSIENGD